MVERYFTLIEDNPTPSREEPWRPAGHYGMFPELVLHEIPHDEPAEVAKEPPLVSLPYLPEMEPVVPSGEWIGA